MSALWVISPTINASVALHSYALEPSGKHTRPADYPERGNPMSLSKGIQSAAAAALSAAMLIAVAACGTTDKARDTASNERRFIQGLGPAPRFKASTPAASRRTTQIAALLPDSVAERRHADRRHRYLLRPGRIPGRGRQDPGRLRRRSCPRRHRPQCSVSIAKTPSPPTFDSIIPCRRLQVRPRHLLLHRDQGAHGGRRLRHLLQGRFHGLRGGRRATRTRSTPNEPVRS